jgi:hypothetical protein
MNPNTTSKQEASESVDEQRATWERMSMTVLDGAGGGYVNVRNDSYGDESGAHIYSVRVESGAAVGCSCPHAVHRGAHCKHQVAVENRPLVVSSASAAGANYSRRVATDGGQPVDGEQGACDECGLSLAEAQEQPTGYVRLTTDGEKLCGACNDIRRGWSRQSGRLTADELDGERGTVDVHGCAACGGFAYGSDDFCSEECRERGRVNETPL